MIANRMTTIATRWLVFVLLAFCVFAPRAQAQNDAPTAINGVYIGTLTNYLDVGGATNKPARYYRVRLVP